MFCGSSWARVKTGYGIRKCEVRDVRCEIREVVMSYVRFSARTKAGSPSSNNMVVTCRSCVGIDDWQVGTRKSHWMNLDRRKWTDPGGWAETTILEYPSCTEFIIHWSKNLYSLLNRSDVLNAIRAAFCAAARSTLEFKIYNRVFS